MTHPTYSQHTLEALPTAQLKAIAKSIGAIPDGDKRSKQVWIDAIIDHQTAFSPIKVAAMQQHIETVMNRLESPADADESALTQTSKPTAETIEPAPSPEKVLNSKSTAPTPTRREASTVALILVVIFGLAILTIKIGLTSIAWVIASLAPLALGLWQYLTPPTKQQESINYFPQV